MSVRCQVTFVRLAFALLTLFRGVDILLYLCAWLVIPEEGDGASIAKTFVNKRRRSRQPPP